MNMTGSQHKRSCAYCGGGELTREHLIPQGYFDRTGGSSEFVGNIKAGTTEKFLSVEPAIADVCRDCNNGVLSRLDTYFFILFDRYFSNVVVQGKRISFEFDFDQLLRWLLKMGYNMGRARQWHGNQNLAACKNYILFGVPRPSNITVLLQVVTPGFIPGPRRNEFPPEMFVVNAMRVPHILKNFSFVLHVGIHCYQFYIAFHDPAINSSTRNNRIKVFQRLFRGAYEVRPSQPCMRIYPSSITLWDLVNGPFWEAGWVQHLRHHFGYALRDKRAKDRFGHS